MDVKKNDVSGKGGREVAAAEACESETVAPIPA